MTEGKKKWRKEKRRNEGNRREEMGEGVREHEMRDETGMAFRNSFAALTQP